MTFPSKLGPCWVREFKPWECSEQNFHMPQERHSVDQIIAKLCWADIEPGKGKSFRRFAGFLRMRNRIIIVFGMQRDMVNELKGLKKENSRLKKMVAKQAPGMEILKEASRGTW